MCSPGFFVRQEKKRVSKKEEKGGWGGQHEKNRGTRPSRPQGGLKGANKSDIKKKKKKLITIPQEEMKKKRMNCYRGKKGGKS